jgi:hypothetical protein
LPPPKQELFFGDPDSISESYFDAGKKSKFLVHGYTANGKDGFVTALTDAYLSIGK